MHMANFLKKWFQLLLPVAVAVVCVPALEAGAAIGVGISVQVAPPPLPVYDQPACPGDGYMWAPGYWAYGPDGYYWVPGAWVVAPQPGLLWTPGYWGWANGVYLWHGGYWGRHVGYYGGVPYGFGYTGVGFSGGYWRGSAFFYNRAVWHVGGGVRNIYAHPVPDRGVAVRVSFNGGPGGWNTRPTPAEMSAAHESHFQPTPRQVQFERGAAANHDFLASSNHGQPSREAIARHQANYPAAAGRPGAGMGARPGAGMGARPGAGMGGNHYPAGGQHPNQGHGPEEHGR